MQRLIVLAAIFGLAATAALAANKGDAEKITFSNQMVRIFQEKCQTCHRPGDIAPMSLMSYVEARPWANPNQQFDPPQDVHFGEASHEEMAIAWTSITFDQQQESIEPLMPAELIATNRAARVGTGEEATTGGR